MALFSKKDTAFSFPVDETATLHITKGFYVHQATDFALAARFADVTSDLAPVIETPPTSLTAPFLEAIKSSATSSSPTIQITRPSRLTRAWTAKDAAGGIIAELSNPLWSLGKWTIKFPADSPHSEHDIQLHPAGMAARADEFVKDSVPYFWDLVDGRKLCRLFRALDGKKVEVARFLGENVRAQEGVLMVSEGIDEVVAMLTFFGVLNRVDSFRA